MRHIINNKYLCLIVLAFLIFRIVNLTAFPPFNDESIYLDWGLREINRPGFLYYSLYDAKQPLLMWMFGIMQNLLPNPIFAGRLVSVFAGLLTLFGLYKITRYVSNRKTALLASFLYILIPIFSFYDRQALMEAAVGAIGVWSCYFFIKCIKENIQFNYIFLGVTLGLGYFIKSSSIVFLTTAFLLIFVYAYLNKKKQVMIEGLFISALCFFASVFLLIINPSFWQTFSFSTRFTLTMPEILNFPLSLWASNFLINLRISFFYLTPVIFLLGMGGMFLIFKMRNKEKIYIALFFLISVGIETLTIRGTIDRYLVSFLPLTLVFVSFFLVYLIDIKKTHLLGLILAVVCIISSFPITLLQVTNQAEYFLTYGKISGIDYYYYLDTFTTGYGLNDTFAYLDNISKNKKIIVGLAENTGNPESAMFVYFYKNPNVKTVYLDSRLLPPEVNKYDCINVGAPTYFVARKNELVGLDKFLVNIKVIKNPYGKNTIGIYTLKTNCIGKTTTLTLQQN